ncbi:MAG: Gfo/Idh/MocA family oxidoreductase [Bacteroidales bacterium]|jgi:predicted dehydrogenase|nr:Gfo/Idh/MocA family oxidoreductase [Bacteroidales bacterium]MDY0086253.1 Gfo/Idh/MocA family oxidoreductase [Bacteroidales bacterium]
MLKIGVLGAGHLGKIHLKCIQQIPEYELIGFYDSDVANAQKVAEDFNLKAFDSIESLIDATDVVDIVTPTVSHFSCAAQSLKKSRHVFIEKPVVATPEEANELIALARKAKVKVQVGHVERFNPAFLAVQNSLNNPLFIEAHRLAQFNPRGTDVPVILDLMVHDIDIVLSSIRSKVKSISASGVAVVSDTPDITNARITFENGAVANLTASRISLKNMRKARFFQKDAYITVDFLEKQSEIVRMKSISKEPDDPMAMVIDLGEGKGSKQISFEKPEIGPVNAIKMELEKFYEAIINDKTPAVSIEDGVEVLRLAYQILDEVNKNVSQIK